MSNLKKLLFVLSVVAVLGVSETVLAKANTESTAGTPGDGSYWSKAVGDTALGGEQFVLDGPLKIKSFSDADVLKLDGTPEEGEEIKTTTATTKITTKKENLTTNFTDKTKEKRQQELKKWYEAGRAAEKKVALGGSFAIRDADGKKLEKITQDTERTKKARKHLKNGMKPVVRPRRK